jgi:hypothetical protein
MQHPANAKLPEDPADFERATTSPKTIIISPEPEFVTLTKEDEDHIRGAA